MSFIKSFILLTLGIGAVIGAIMYATNIFSHPAWVWMGLAFFAGLALASYSFVMNGVKLANNKFINRFLVLTFSRILLAAIFLSIYLVINRERDIAFVVVFMLLYLFYTLFEMYHLVTKLRAEKYERVEDTKS